MRLESVASGYWTLILNQSSGFVSHWGSTPSLSASHSTTSNLLDKAVARVILEVLRISV